MAINPMQTAPSDAATPLHEPPNDSLVDVSTAPRLISTKLDPTRTYSLAELMAMAQENNRTTRLAWQQARAAAVAVGLSAAEWYPMLAVAASYGGGLYDLEVGFGNNLSGLEREAGVLGALFAGAEGSQLSNPRQRVQGAYGMGMAGLNLRWLLFDFGTRSAKMNAAQKSQLAANLHFNDAHQKLALTVTQAFYALEGARAQVRAAEASVAAATEICAAAEAQNARGLLTEPELLQARQSLAEARYIQATSEAAGAMALVDLCEAIGVPPTPELRLSASPLIRQEAALPRSLDEAVQSALHHRPDLLAKVATVQAAEAELRAARRDRLPKIALEGLGGYSRLDASVQGAGPLDQFEFGLQNYGGFLTVQWPLFTGFAEENKVRGAEIARAAAQEEMELLREGVIAEVWRAYTKAKNAWSQLEAALALEKATRSSYEAALAEFERGRLALPEVLAARAAQAQAAFLVAESRLATASTAAALAFAMGPK